jgi:hypothetical protein
MIIAAPVTPPTTPPAIAPVSEEEFTSDSVAVGPEVAEVVECVDVIAVPDNEPRFSDFC